MDATNPADLAELRLLVCHDLDLRCAVHLSDQLIQRSRRFDLVLLCGPFTSALNRIPISAEEEAIRIADISSIIAQFENVVCRVVFLPSDYDPSKLRSDRQLFLTPNSMGINQSMLPLTPSLGIIGFLEDESMLNHEAPMPFDFDRSQESDDELEGIVIKSSSSVPAIQLLLENVKAAQTSPTSKLFVLNYKFAASLNQFLYHMPHLTNDIFLCVLPQVSENPLNVPLRHGPGTVLLSPKSLRTGGYHYELVLSRNSSGWEVSELVEVHHQQENMLIGRNVESHT